MTNDAIYTGNEFYQKKKIQENFAFTYHNRINNLAERQRRFIEKQERLFDD